MWDEDPQLRQLILNYQQGKAGLTPPAQPAPTPAVQQVAPAIPPAQPVQPTPTSNLPQLTADDLADPTVRALYESAQVAHQTASATTQQVAELQTQVERYRQETAMREFNRQAQEYTNIVEGVVSSFKSTYRLPDDVMSELRQTAGRLGAALTYMNGIHPITGQPVVPDPTMATRVALEAAYYANPKTQAIEQQRILERAQQSFRRKAKLGGVSGAGGSAPRQPPAPTDDVGRRNAMNREVGEMLRGEWTEQL